MCASRTNPRTYLDLLAGCMIYRDLMPHYAPSYYGLSVLNLFTAIIDVTVVRSCPSAIWPRKISSAEWDKSTNIVYDGSSGQPQLLNSFALKESKSIVMKFFTTVQHSTV